MGHDQPTRTIAEFAASVKLQDLSETAVTAVVRHHLDAIGCALGGFEAVPCRIARDLARTALTEPGCSVLGIDRTVAPEQAVFANVSMVRQLDYNDSYGGGGHPSDMIPVVIAASELSRASGRDAILGIFTAYEVFAAISESYAARDAGWDQGPFIAVSAAMGAGVVLGLGFQQLANAVGLAVTPSMALHCSRTGELSNWKGCATAHGAMSGLFAARLAERGLTGPSAPFEGVDGLHRQIPPEKAITIGGLKEGLTAVERTSFKRFPAVIHSQGLIEALLAARKSFRIEDIEKISIDTYKEAWSAVGGGYGDSEEKWNPKTRETADHSLPYITAVALLDGDVNVRSFSPERIADPAVRDLMQTVCVNERADLSALFPRERRCDIRIELRDRSVIELSTAHPLGRPENPMSDIQLSEKFNRLATQVLSEQAAKSLETVLWEIASLKDLGDLMRHYRAIMPAQN